MIQLRFVCLETLPRLIGLRPHGSTVRPLDPLNIYLDSDVPDDRRALWTACTVAILFHALLLVIRFAADIRIHLPEDRHPLLQQLAPLRLLDAGGKTAVSPPRMSRDKPKPQPVYFPDPTPEDPEALESIQPDPIPRFSFDIENEFSIGEISGPPGSGTGPRGNTGTGGGAPGGTGKVYPLQGGVQAPVLLHREIPLYTEQARRARVEGIVVIQAIVRRDGSVDSFRVIRGLGHGLDESAIHTIATRWRFKPGTLNGEEVDVLATIEVSFRLF
jgi:TonB family protein